MEGLRHSSSSVYSSSRLARGRGHTHWLGELKTTDSQVFSFRDALTGDQQGQQQQQSSYNIHKNMLLLNKVGNVSCEYDRLNG